MNEQGKYYDGDVEALERLMTEAVARDIAAFDERMRHQNHWSTRLLRILVPVGAACLAGALYAIHLIEVAQ